MIFYFMDGLINKVVDGVVVASYAPPGNADSGGQPYVKYAVPLPDGTIILLGAIEVNGDESERTGVVVDSDLNLVNDQWNRSSIISEWEFPNGDMTTDLGEGWSGAGAAYDSVTDKVYLTTPSLERDDGPPDHNVIDEYFLVVLSKDGDPLDAAISSLTADFAFIGPSSTSDAEGTSMNEATRKLYYIAGSSGDTVTEYNVDTGAIRWAQCFEGNHYGHLEVHPVTGDLWLSEHTPFEDQLMKLHRFEVDTIPWGTDFAPTGFGTPVAPDEEVILWNEDTSADGLFSPLYAFCFIDATTVLYQAQVWDSGNVAWFRQTLGGSPELLLDLGSDWFDLEPQHDIATQVWAFSTPVPDIRSSTHPARLRWSTPMHAAAAPHPGPTPSTNPARLRWGGLR